MQTAERRNLVEHGLPLMLRVGEVGNRFSELLGLQELTRRSSCCARANRCTTSVDRRYFVCVHKGGDNFSLPGTDSLMCSNHSRRIC